MQEEPTVSERRRHSKVILRDLMIFQLKLFIDGLKDLVLLPASVGAAAIDIIFPGRKPGRCFYSVLRIGETFDRYLSLYNPAQQALAGRDGLFGASRAGSATLLGELEAMVLGHEEPRPTRRAA